MLVLMWFDGQTILLYLHVHCKYIIHCVIKYTWLRIYVHACTIVHCTLLLLPYFTLLFFKVVELLLAKGANFEHRNVSDYTPLSLAASGGYVAIIKMLLKAGADINSRYYYYLLYIIIYCVIIDYITRTGSKLGISPLMLAAMNGHTATVKLLLDFGSDINSQVRSYKDGCTCTCMT